MSVQVKFLTIGAPLKDLSTSAPPTDAFNLIPTANDIYDLYVAANDMANNNKKSAVVSSIRLINTHATNAAKVTLYFNRPTSPENGQNRRRLLTPADMSLPPNYVYIDEAELTLEPGDKIQGKTDTAGVVQYLISGVERDVV